MEPEDREFTDKLEKLSVTDKRKLRQLMELIAGKETPVLLHAGGVEVVAMSTEEYESLMETIEVLSDEELVQGIEEGLEDLKAGRVYTHEEVFGHPLGDAPKD